MNDDGKPQNDIAQQQDEQAHELIEQLNLLEAIDRRITPEHVAKRFRELLADIGDDDLPGPEVVRPQALDLDYGATDVPEPPGTPGLPMPDPLASGQVMARLRDHMASEDPVAALTGQERRVLELIGEGLTNRQIAERMFLAEKTAKNYVSSLLAKLGMHRRAEAATFAVRRRGLSNNGTASGDSGLKTAGLPPLAPFGCRG